MANNIPKTAIELCNRLIKIHDNKPFVLGVIGTTSTDEDRQTLIDFIDCGVDVSITSVTELAYKLRCKRDGEPIYQFKHEMSTQED